MIHINGSDLARIYAAGIAASNPNSDPRARVQEAGEYVQGFLSLLTGIDGKPPHVGDPFVWEQQTDVFPEQVIDNDWQ